MPWQEDRHGNERPGRAKAARLIQRLRARGLPCRTSYEERSSGRYACLRIDPDPTFHHFSSPECVEYCLQHHGQYHATLANTGRLLRLSPLTNVRRAFDRVRTHFSTPRHATLRVAWVNDKTFVAHVPYTDVALAGLGPPGPVPPRAPWGGTPRATYVTISL